jgi:putative ABC transport system ATP-binding protein
MVVVLVGASRVYGAVVALQPTSLRLEAGRTVAIVGPSGSGKSTLLHLLGALDRQTAGEVWLDDVELGALDDDARARLRRERIGFVFQFFNLVETLSALDNVLLPAELAGRADRAVRARARTLLERVGLGHRADHKPTQLSGGELQRVAVARALLLDPPLVLADEPTGNLDREAGRRVLELLLGAADARRTVVLVTHDEAIAARADHVIRLVDGRVVEDRPNAHVVAHAPTGDVST